MAVEIWRARQRCVRLYMSDEFTSGVLHCKCGKRKLLWPHYQRFFWRIRHFSKAFPPFVEVASCISNAGIVRCDSTAMFPCISLFGRVRLLIFSGSVGGLVRVWLAGFMRFGARISEAALAAFSRRVTTLLVECFWSFQEGGTAPGLLLSLSGVFLRPQNQYRLGATVAVV